MNGEMGGKGRVRGSEDSGGWNEGEGDIRKEWRKGGAVAPWAQEGRHPMGGCLHPSRGDGRSCL